MDHVEALRDRWDREWKSQGVCDEMRRALLDTGMHRHYAWASHLANYYGACYRNAFFANYMLAWVAVLMAALGVVFHQGGRHTLTVIAAGLECALLLAIVLIVRKGSRSRFHARWLDYRRLAEWIRSLPMMLPLSRTPVRGVETNPLLAAEESWLHWMFRAVIREAGVVPLDLSEHLHGAQSILANGVLKGQIDYHERTAARNARADRALHKLSTGIFRFALLLAVAHLADLVKAFIPQVLQDPLLVTILVLPALGAALHGLRSQGEFEVSALRSERIRERMKDLREELEAIAPPSVEELAGVAVKTATVMNSELGAWFLAYQSKGIGYT